MIRRATIAFARFGLFALFGAFALFGHSAAPATAQDFTLATPEEVGLSSERLQRIDAAFLSYAEEGRIAGAVGWS